ncbi:hypothetical protein N7G274_004054 [Stereocaulon virgatum]|uniref:Uncharacterized protein n=1 Tax=Stereocaulon virgatum TaxID=373712 RepID=A0ABR4ADU2_9LECA
MYHPFKKRKVERDVEHFDYPTGRYGFQQGRERARTLGQPSKKEMPNLPKIVLPSPEDEAADTLKPPRQEVQSLCDSSEASANQPTELRRRQLIPAPVRNAVPATAKPVATMVAVDISNGNKIVSHVVEPMSAGGTVNVPGVGEVNVTDASTSPAPLSNPANTPNVNNFVPGSVVPPAAIQASSARSAALQSQQAIANQFNSVSQSAITSAIPEGRGSAASQSPMNLPESSSQQVLSSPSTPLPSTTQFSTTSSSYFSSTPSPSPTSNPSANTLSTSSNSTTSATSIDSSAAASSSLNALNSESSAMASLFAQSTASQASIASFSTMAAAASTLNGFVTSTRSDQSLSSGLTATPTLDSSASLSIASQSSASAASVASNTGVGVGGIGGSNIGTAPTSTPSSGSGSGNNNAPPTPVLVGGIVGGVAGLVMVLMIVLLFFRWRRNQSGQRRIISPPLPQTIGQGSGPQSGSGTMTQRSSTAPIVGGILGRMRPLSSQTARTAATTDTAPSERGFQKLSGRKLPSVLASGGDGYGDNAAGTSTGSTGPISTQRSPGMAVNQGPFAALAPGLRPSQPSPSHSLSGSSFYRDSQGFYGGIVPDIEKTESFSSPVSSSPTTIAPLSAAAGSLPRRDEIANMRPGPARTPVINQPGQVPGPPPQQPSPRPRGPPGPVADFPRVRDGLGRSHPSQDGSRGSRFREDTTPP